MKKYNEYRSIVFTITTALVFFLWGLLESQFKNNSGTDLVYSALIGTVVSLGSYRLVLKLIEGLAIKFKIVKRLIFGRSFLDGIWVGAYIGKDGSPRYIIEYFEQDLNSLIIRGKCYYDDKRYKGDWKSTNVSIDEEKGELAYTYDTTMKDNGFKTIGFAVFTFIRSSKSSPPTKLYGFSSDIDSATMNQAVEEKIAYNKNYSETELLNRAILVYERNKNTLLKH